MSDYLQIDPLPNLYESPESQALQETSERWGFWRPTRGVADVSVSENHVWSLLLHKVILSLENFWKTLRKVHFCITKMARKSMKDSYVLKKPVPEQRHIILT